MSRTIRPYIRGVAFHLTARTQGRQPWFDDRIRDDVANIIKEGIAASDARLLAWAVMPNHFHLVLQHGARPLGWIMQPIMRRVSLKVQRAHGIEGHVFERRFRSYPCADASYLRNAIVYTNLNPKRAGLCSDGASYKWCSYSAFMTTILRSDSPEALIDALRLFATTPRAEPEQIIADYQSYVAWRIEKDRCDDVDELCMTAEPKSAGGDAFFAQRFCSLPGTIIRPTRDLRDRAREVLAEIEPAMSLSDLHGARLPRSLRAIRRQLVASLLQAGYRGRSIATFLRVSDSAVSQVASQMRYAVETGK